MREKPNRKNIREEDKLRQDEIEDGVKKLFTRWMITVCRTSTIAILGIATYAGSWTADHSGRVMAALRALFGDGR